MSSESEAGDGKVTEYEGQSAVEQAIWQGIHHKCFYLAEKAPIFHGPMREAFGCLATMIAARQVLEDSYAYPDNFDEAKKDLCKACARIQLGVPPCLVNTTIKHE